MARNLKSTRRYIPTEGGNRELSEEEQVSCTIKRITVGAMFEIQASIRSSDAFSQVADGGVDLNDANQIEGFWTLLEKVLGEYTEAWRGIYLDGKELADPKDVLAACDADQLPLLAEVFNETMGFSNGDEATAKNSDTESVPENSDSDTIAEAA